MLVITSSRAQRLATLQMDFVTAVSHELRTPLNAVLGFAQLLEMDTLSDYRRAQEYFGHPVS
jgi:signal transduction histidine kinase